MHYLLESDEVPWGRVSQACRTSIRVPAGRKFRLERGFVSGHHLPSSSSPLIAGELNVSLVESASQIQSTDRGPHSKQFSRISLGQILVFQVDLCEPGQRECIMEDINRVTPPRDDSDPNM